ncbi:MAG TPA: hypothetical protein VM639_24585 [Dongiaceae bacterium]|nr:hypothetical protein [Dongiaceae bacterium]
MGEKMSAEIKKALAFDLRMELQKRLSPAKRRAHQIDPEILAGWLADHIEASNWIIRRGEPLKAHSISYDLPVRNERPDSKA